MRINPLLPTMKKHVLTRLSLPALAVAGIALSGCTLYSTPQAPQVQEPLSQTQPTTLPSSVNTTGNFTITGEEDGTQFQFGGTLPSDWPDTLPIIPNSTLAFATSERDEQAGTVTFSATFSSQDSFENILRDAKSSYSQAGWNIGDEYSGSFGIATAGFTGTMGQNEVTISVLSDPSQPNQASVTIVGEYEI
jgi:hypothetical protein